MNRRNVLLGLLGGGAALAAGELWVPGAKKIFLPPKGGWAVPAPIPYVYIPAEYWYRWEANVFDIRSGERPASDSGWMQVTRADNSNASHI